MAVLALGFKSCSLVLLFFSYSLTELSFKNTHTIKASLKSLVLLFLRGHCFSSKDWYFDLEVVEEGGGNEKPNPDRPLVKLKLHT